MQIADQLELALPRSVDWTSADPEHSRVNEKAWLAYSTAMPLVQEFPAVRDSVTSTRTCPL